MRRVIFCFVAFFIAGHATAQEFSLPQSNDSKVDAKKDPPFVGRWKVVSQLSGSNLIAIPDNDLFLSSDLFAEYDRINDPEKPIISLWNVKWTGKAPEYSTKLFSSPPSTMWTERFSVKSIAAYCYLKTRGNSAVLVISESKINKNPFVTNGSAANLDANARILTLFRISEDPQTRLSHLKSFAELKAELTRFLPKSSENKLVDSIHGGFLEEYQAAVRTK